MGKKDQKTKERLAEREEQAKAILEVQNRVKAACAVRIHVSWTLVVVSFISLLFGPFAVPSVFVSPLEQHDNFS